jgi:ParB family transcriptional regulator, chromosome partitioning protein
MSKQPDRQALGKGLSSLLPPRLKQTPAPESAQAERPVGELPVNRIKPSPFQPRRQFRDEPLQELAQSIRVNGIIQPIAVRKAGDEYQIVAGERRWRAAQLAGLAMIPVVVQEIGDDKLLEVALIENIQREDLNPIELAEAFERMVTELSLSHEEIGRRTGKDRVTVTNTIRLLQLQPEVQQIVASGKLSAGHARALIGIKDADRQKNIAYSVIAEGWTVRQIEKAVKDIVQGNVDRPEKPPAPPIDPNVRAAIDEMQRALGTRVRVIEKGKGKGHIEIEYYSSDDLDRIYTMITSSS